MKKVIIILFILFTSIIYAQGETTTPYDTTGWDEPQTFTDHYSFPIYRLLSNPGGWINRSQALVDSLLYELIVYTDSTQLCIENDTLKFSPTFLATLLASVVLDTSNIKASSIKTDTTNFNGVLSGADSAIQEALDTIDDAYGSYKDSTWIKSAISDSLTIKSDTSHTHPISDIVNLSDSLSAKMELAQVQSAISDSIDVVRDQITVWTNDVSNPPLITELNAILGTAASRGAGFTIHLDDAGAGLNFYTIVSDGTNWWIFTGTKAL